MGFASDTVGHANFIVETSVQYIIVYFSLLLYLTISFTNLYMRANIRTLSPQLSSTTYNFTKILSK